MKITLGVLAVWPIGTKYIDYATKRETTIVGFRVSTDVYTEQPIQEIRPEHVNRVYITKSFNGVSWVTNYETPASRIFRSIDKLEKVNK